MLETIRPGNTFQRVKEISLQLKTDSQPQSQTQIDTTQTLTPEAPSQTPETHLLATIAFNAEQLVDTYLEQTLLQLQSLQRSLEQSVPLQDKNDRQLENVVRDIVVAGNIDVLYDQIMADIAGQTGLLDRLEETGLLESLVHHNLEHIAGLNLHWRKRKDLKHTAGDHQRGSRRIRIAEGPSSKREIIEQLVISGCLSDSLYLLIHERIHDLDITNDHHMTEAHAYSADENYDKATSVEARVGLSTDQRFYEHINEDRIRAALEAIDFFFALGYNHTQIAELVMRFEKDWDTSAKTMPKCAAFIEERKRELNLTDKQLQKLVEMRKIEQRLQQLYAKHIAQNAVISLNNSTETQVGRLDPNQALQARFDHTLGLYNNVIDVDQRPSIDTPYSEEEKNRFTSATVSVRDYLGEEYFLGFPPDQLNQIDRLFEKFHVRLVPQFDLSFKDKSYYFTDNVEAIITYKEDETYVRDFLQRLTIEDTKKTGGKIKNGRLPQFLHGLQREMQSIPMIQRVINRFSKGSNPIKAYLHERPSPTEKTIVLSLILNTMPGGGKPYVIQTENTSGIFMQTHYGNYVVLNENVYVLFDAIEGALQSNNPSLIEDELRANLDEDTIHTIEMYKEQLMAVGRSILAVFPKHLSLLDLIYNP